MSKDEYLKTKSNNQRLKILIRQLAWFEPGETIYLTPGLHPFVSSKEVNRLRSRLAVQLADLVNPIPENL